MLPFLNPNIEVVTFRLRGWCMLGFFFVFVVLFFWFFFFLLPAFTRLRHMSGSFESMRWSACVHRLDLGLSSHPKEVGVCLGFFWGEGGGDGVRTHVNSKGKIPSTEKILYRGGSNPRCCIKQDSEPNTLPASYSVPRRDNCTC